MPNKKNIAIHDKLNTKAKNAKSVIFADYTGLKSNLSNELRDLIKKVNGEMSVSKNTLLNKALETSNTSVAELKASLKGQIATIFSYGDPLAPLKAVVEFSKKFDLPKLKFGIIEGKYTSAEQLDIYSKLPSKEILIAKALGSMKSPLTGLVNTLSGVQKNFVSVLSEISKKSNNF